MTSPLRLGASVALCALLSAALVDCSDPDPPYPQVDAAGAPLSAACLSGRYWAFGERGDNNMHPGRPCITCHTQSGHGPHFTVAGTVYAAANEVDECLGVDSEPTPNAAVEVEVTDQSGQPFFITANRVGNFFTTHEFRFPLQRIRVYNVGRRSFTEMASPAPHGDCNACHSRTGTISPNGQSPGRVTLPR